MRLNILTLVVVVSGLIAFAVLGGHLAWTPEHIAGIGIFVPAFVLFIVARLQLGSAFSVQAKATKLVTTGLYSRIRNPIYVFGALMIVGVVVFVGQPLWLLVLVALLPLQVWRSGKEAKVLEEKFGEEYRQYRKKTWF